MAAGLRQRSSTCEIRQSANPRRRPCHRQALPRSAAGRLGRRGLGPADEDVAYVFKLSRAPHSCPCYYAGTMALTRDEVLHVAKLARVGVTDDDVAKFQSQLSAILDHFSALNEIDTKDVPPTTQSL